MAFVVWPLIAGGCQRPGDSRAGDRASASTPSAAVPALELPLAGTEIPLFPPGEARALAQTHCLACHASDMIQQQRLGETEWRAEVDKMQRWGADIGDEDKAALVLYLTSRFGPDNDRFMPIAARPETRSPDSAQTQPGAPKFSRNARNLGGIHP